ncbi:hypothetical protein D3C74_182970 [compost metagenome]
MKVVGVIVSSIFFIFAALFLIISIGGFVGKSVEIGWIGLVFTFVFIGAGLLMLVVTRKRAGTEVNKNKLKENGVIAYSKMHHVEGLPLGENTVCTVSVTHNSMVIEGGGTNFVLEARQIRAAEVKTDIEIANIVHSSAVKGVAGGLLFGPIGLVVGARATNKQKKNYTYYLIINYENSKGELTALMFDGGNLPLGAQKIANKLKPITERNPKVTVQL